MEEPAVSTPWGPMPMGESPADALARIETKLNYLGSVVESLGSVVESLGPVVEEIQKHGALGLVRALRRHRADPG